MSIELKPVSIKNLKTLKKLNFDTLEIEDYILLKYLDTKKLVVPDTEDCMLCQGTGEFLLHSAGLSFVLFEKLDNYVVSNYFTSKKRVTTVFKNSKDETIKLFGYDFYLIRPMYFNIGSRNSGKDITIDLIESEKLDEILPDLKKVMMKQRLPGLKITEQTTYRELCRSLVRKIQQTKDPNYLYILLTTLLL